GGNATHAVIDSSDITGNVTTDSMSNCSVGGSATYDTRFACSVSGSTTTPNPTIFAPPDIIPLPVSDAQIDQWESDATAGGTLGTQNFVTGTRNLGPVKIVGDLLLSNDAQVVVTGTIWVTGTIRLSNTAIMRLHPSYGSLSGVVLAGIDGDANAGYIEVGNFSQALGSGTAGSYIMLLSQKTGFGSNAIRNSNNGTAAILYAGDGMIEINNFASMKEITAAKLRVTNNAVVTYETGLANANFSSGPGGGWEIADQTWQLIQ
ncbi:MAG TPA: hypothetical protein VD998_02875, partial [Verrucomicrobiae bacterium]|nr:hypothetical protein [Verrucomicrobiae bacterium]